MLDYPIRYFKVENEEILAKVSEYEKERGDLFQSWIDWAHQFGGYPHKFYLLNCLFFSKDRIGFDSDSDLNFDHWRVVKKEKIKSTSDTLAFAPTETNPEYDKFYNTRPEKDSKNFLNTRKVFNHTMRANNHCQYFYFEKDSRLYFHTDAVDYIPLEGMVEITGSEYIEVVRQYKEQQEPEDTKPFVSIESLIKNTLIKTGLDDVIDITKDSDTGKHGVLIEPYRKENDVDIDDWDDCEVVCLEEE
jgi:hypothetical protein